MHRAPLLRALEEYDQTWVTGLAPYRSFDRREEANCLEEFRNFVLEETACFSRETPRGHVTGSALVTTMQMDSVLLTLHRKLGKWLQLGGHSDGNPKPEQVALREAAEESGLRDLAFVPFEKVFGPGLTAPLLLDLDIHTIPARGAEPEHWHLDVRFLLFTKDPQSIHISEESQDLAWHTLNKARELTSERSMQRQFDKLEYLSARVDPRALSKA